MIGIGVGIFILMKLDSTIVIELRCHISGDYWGFISYVEREVMWIVNICDTNFVLNPMKACVLVNWAIIRYLQQLKLKKKILKMAMMKAGFESNPVRRLFAFS